MTWRDAAMLAVGSICGAVALYGWFAWIATADPFTPKQAGGQTCLCRASYGQCSCLLDLLTEPPAKAGK